MKQFESLIKYLYTNAVYEQTAELFISDVYAFADAHAEYELNSYMRILEDNGLKWDYQVLFDADVSRMDAQCVLAMLMGAVRAERFCEGILLDFLKSGAIHKWLKRLKEIDGDENLCLE